MRNPPPALNLLNTVNVLRHEIHAHAADFLLTPALALSLLAAGTLADAAQSQPGAAPQSTNTAPAATAPQAKLSQQDASFLAEASRAASTGQDLARMAMQQAQAPAIKALASKLFEDHGVISLKLKSLAQQKQRQDASAPDAAQQQDMEHLYGLQGDKFEAEWIKIQTKASQDALVAWSQEVANGSDPQVVALAKQTLPVLKSHLDYLQKLPASHG
ncbi:DUF4142 domain-containing protein [Silvimonas iriomotensis]|uniref:DUF4142 domain-containing protein n=1 Tax=Silvimonas iriomotensis TaxID=449662 RepID=A0ABQ2P4Q2_9NEIS|nr:DUF4142 domain-containing protein [Silvimonas iriomotensis]GGP18244.1 hypothetical protein GCM10010970_03900 [Silvimonas iriomotensis]